MAESGGGSILKYLGVIKTLGTCKSSEDESTSESDGGIACGGRISRIELKPEQNLCHNQKSKTSPAYGLYVKDFKALNKLVLPPMPTVKVATFA